MGNINLERPSIYRDHGDDAIDHSLAWDVGVLKDANKVLKTVRAFDVSNGQIPLCNDVDKETYVAR